MYALEYKQLYIPREALTKNRCFQGYRWKQYAVCEEREPLEQIKATKKRPEEWRVVPLADSVWPPAAGHLGRAAPNKATRPHAQNQITNQEVHKMAWLYIPAETGERIETICNQHYNPGRGACDCPLWPACSYSNDLTKSSAENTRIFEQGMAAALAALDNENRR